jgi:hypothetical protein
LGGESLSSFEKIKMQESALALVNNESEELLELKNTQYNLLMLQQYV